MATATDMKPGPLYPAYLPTRPEGYAPVIDVPAFKGEEPGARANPSKPNLLRLGVQARNITPRIGTEINGVQLSKLSKEGLNELALLAAERGVLIFVCHTSDKREVLQPADFFIFQRDQDFANIGFDKQRDLVRHFGPLHQHPTMGYPEGTGPEFHVVYADKNEGNLRTLLGPRTTYDLWHVDQTFTRNLPSTTFFWVLEMPESGGGDTAFTSLSAAYEALSPAFRRMIAPLSLLHTSASVGEIARVGTERALREAVKTVHPLVIKHPVTGKPSLFVNPTIARKVEGMLPEESDTILKFLHDHIKSLDFSCRIKWETGSVVVWDQRNVAHSAVPDFKDGERRHVVRMIPYGSPSKPAFPEFYKEETPS